VIAAEGVVGVEGFAAGVCWGGVAGLVLSPGAADGATAAEGIGVDGFAAGICDGGVLRLVRSVGDGVDVPGATAAGGVVAAGVCDGGVPGLAPPVGTDEGVAGGAAADGDVGATAFFVGTCDGAADGLLGAIAAEGVVGLVGVPVADGSGCPFIPGNGWPG